MDGDKITRGFSVEVFCDKEMYPGVMDDLKRYRFVARHVAALRAMAENALATEAVNKKGFWHVAPPKGMDALLTLESVINDHRKGKVSGLRAYVMKQFDNWCSDIADGVLADVDARMKAKDPEHGTARRNYLIVNGLRSAPAFDFIGLPIRPRGGNVDLKNRTFTLEWNRNRGPIAFRMGKLDGSRHYIFGKLASGEWKMGDPIRLNERDGTLRITFGYTRPAEKQPELDEGRTVEAAFGEDRAKLLTLGIREGHESLIDEMRKEVVDACPEADWLAQQKQAQERINGLRSACGNRRERRFGGGNRKGYEHFTKILNGMTTTRTHFTQTANHRWSAKLVAYAVRWRCKNLAIFDVPKGLNGEPWPWAQFKTFVEYKAKAVGVVVRWHQSPGLEDLEAAVGPNAGTCAR